MTLFGSFMFLTGLAIMVVLILWFTREPERDKKPTITAKQLERVLVKCWVVQAAAVDDPEGYDNYSTVNGIRKAAEMLSEESTTRIQPKTRARI